MHCICKRFRDIKRKVSQGSRHMQLDYRVNLLGSGPLFSNVFSYWLWVFVCEVNLFFIFIFCHTSSLFQHGEISQDQTAANWSWWWKGYPTSEGATGTLFYPFYFLSLPGCSLASWMWSHLWQNPSHRYPFFMHLIQKYSHCFLVTVFLTTTYNCVLIQNGILQNQNHFINRQALRGHLCQGEKKKESRCIVQTLVTLNMQNFFLPSTVWNQQWSEPS